MQDNFDDETLQDITSAIVIERPKVDI